MLLNLEVIIKLQLLDLSGPMFSTFLISAWQGWGVNWSIQFPLHNNEPVHCRMKSYAPLQGTEVSFLQREEHLLLIVR